MVSVCVNQTGLVLTVDLNSVTITTVIIMVSAIMAPVFAIPNILEKLVSLSVVEITVLETEYAFRILDIQAVSAMIASLVLSANLKTV